MARTRKSYPELMKVRREKIRQKTLLAFFEVIQGLKNDPNAFPTVVRNLHSNVVKVVNKEMGSKPLNSVEIKGITTHLNEIYGDLMSVAAVLNRLQYPGG
jgi:hypothetical protein